MKNIFLLPVALFAGMCVVLLLHTIMGGVPLMMINWSLQLFGLVVPIEWWSIACFNVSLAVVMIAVLLRYARHDALETTRKAVENGNVLDMRLIGVKDE